MHICIMNTAMVVYEKPSILPLVWAILWFVQYLWTVHCDCIDRVHQTLKEKQDQQQQRAKEKIHRKLNKIYQKLKEVETRLNPVEL